MYANLPENARCVTGESNEFRLVEVLGNLSRADGIHGANRDE